MVYLRVVLPPRTPSSELELRLLSQRNTSAWVSSTFSGFLPLPEITLVKGFGVNVCGFPPCGQCSQDMFQMLQSYNQHKWLLKINEWSNFLQIGGHFYCSLMNLFSIEVQAVFISLSIFSQHLLPTFIADFKTQRLYSTQGCNFILIFLC